MAASAANSNSLPRPLDDDAVVAAGGLLLDDVDVRCLELLVSGVGLPLNIVIGLLNDALKR